MIPWNFQDWIGANKSPTILILKCIDKSIYFFPFLKNQVLWYLFELRVRKIKILDNSKILSQKIRKFNIDALLMKKALNLGTFRAIRKMTWKSCQEFTTPTRCDKMQFRNWMSGLKCNALKANGSNPWLDASNRVS